MLTSLLILHVCDIAHSQHRNNIAVTGIVTGVVTGKKWSMAERRSMVFKSRRVGLSSRFSGGPPLTQIHGKTIQSAKQQKAEASSPRMNGDSDPFYDPVMAPPESSDAEAEDIPTKQGTASDGDDSDKDYDRRRTADIRTTSFGKAASRASSTQSSKPKIRPPRALNAKPYSSRTEDTSSSAGSKRSAEEERPRELNQLERELEASHKKKKKPSRVTYGLQPKSRGANVSQPEYSAAKDGLGFSGSQDSEQDISAGNSFRRVESISPMISQSEQKSFKKKQSADLDDESEGPKPKFKNLPRHSSSPFSTPTRPHPRHMSPIDEFADDTKSKPGAQTTQKSRKRAQADQPLERESTKEREPFGSVKEAMSQAPVFKMPDIDDIDSFDDSGSLDAPATPAESQDNFWDRSEIEEIGSTTTSRCPMCYQEVDRELLEKHSKDGKMSVKQQTAFCRLHKRKSAAKTGTQKGYPTIRWETLGPRFDAHKDFLKNILEGRQASHYRKILKERVESGKNRTLLTNNDNLTPGYYGPRGLRVMTEFIMGKLSDVIRRRAVEDKLISVRSYTGYVQTVLVPELTVRLIMEDMSVTEERAREVLQESVEVGELLHEEARDVIGVDEKEEDSFLLEA